MTTVRDIEKRRREVPCSYCGAKPGQWCTKRLTGEPVDVFSHSARCRLADAAPAAGTTTTGRESG